MNVLLNRKATRDFILKKIKVMRPGWDCTSVSSKVINEIDSFLRMKIEAAIHHHPTKGKTFKYFQ